ncbi:hypothetical protein BC827DRAFT_1268700 [Russula dissimulans]|nr:hypothetical protein BC827DRAFT_1268700 [Russula dissimulans]
MPQPPLSGPPLRAPQDGHTRPSYWVQNGGASSERPEPQRGTGHGSTQQPPLDRSTSVLPGHVPHPPTSSLYHGSYPLGFAGQQSTAPVAAQFQRPAGNPNAVGGSHHSQVTSPQTVVSSPASRPIREFPSVLPRPFHFQGIITIQDLSGTSDLHADARTLFSLHRKKRALIIGTNYPHHQSRMRLSHAVDDAYASRTFFWYYHSSCAERYDIFSDDTPFSDTLQMKDMTEMRDGLSEAMCAIDYVGGEEWEDRNANTPGLIVDTAMHHVMVKPLPSQCRLTVIYDCCHSGTLLNLPFIYNAHGCSKDSHTRIHGRSWVAVSHADVISLSASKDHQRPLHGLNLAINFAGVPLLYETLWK